MDSHSECVQHNSFHPNGLLLKGAASVTRQLDPSRWAIAEERTAELISRIQPNWTAENHRNAVASYVQQLIAKCVPCKVFTFGSVPLRTYLPDGDIDLTAFSEDHNVKDDWAKSILDMLRKEEKNECAEFQVKEVQYIQAETLLRKIFQVKIIKCLVNNIVVDISFNQLGGLCTLCFLEEVDNLINQNHLFKRSIILIKAWCYYESRILGAHHGLISTYALETLVLYIFHVFNNSFAGPLEVLYRFVEFFSKFDWANFCVSLWGPVPICSLPIMAADPPRKDGAELLLNKMFLNACSTAYSVFPRRQDNPEQPFISKHFNVVDPLRRNNNLGRSVSKGNFYRIRSAFSFGAQQLAKILECQQENIVAEVNQFFVNTWDRHGKGCRPDAPIRELLHQRQFGSKQDRNCRKNTSIENAAQNFASQYPEIDESHNSFDFLMQPSSFPGNQIARAIDVQKDLHSPRQKDCEGELRILLDSGWDQYFTQRKNPTMKQQNEKERIFRENILQSRRHANPQFARTSSSPELTSMSSESAPVHRHKAPTGRVKEATSSRSEHNRSRETDKMENLVVNCFTGPYTNENASCLIHTPDSSNSLGCYVSKPVTSSTKSLVYPGDEASQRHQLRQDFMHMHMPLNIASHPFISVSPSIPGYRPQHSGAPVAPYHQLNPAGATLEIETISALNGEPVSLEVDHMSDDFALWTDCNADDSMREIDHESENFSAASSRLSPVSSARSCGTKGSSESSWDGNSSKMDDAMRYPVTNTKSSSVKPTAAVNSRQLDGPVDHIYNDVDDNSAAPFVNSLHGETNMLPGFGHAHLRYPNSMLPFAPLLVRPGSQQGVNHNHAVLPVAFYPAGPPVPFVTMVPVCNVNAEAGATGAPASHDDAEIEKPTFPVNQPSHSSASLKELDQLNHSNFREHPDDCEPDIFNSDFASHWKNLQYGRFCQNSQLQHPFAPSVLVPSLHFQGNASYPRSPNAPAHPVHVPVQQPGPSESAGVSRQYGGEFPKHRNGTGTYFPNPEVLRDRQFVTSKQHQVDSKHDRNEYSGEREANWNFNWKPRFASRVHPRHRNDKRNSKIDRSVASSSQTYRPCDTFRKNSCQLYNFPKDPCTPKSTWNEHYDADHSIYQTRPEYHDEVFQSGDALCPFVMMYPYPQNIPYGPFIESLQFGSVGPEFFIGADKVQVFRGYPEGSELEQQNYQGEPHPPDFACPPRFLR
ncbi:Poly(A) RNA polymerase cid14 [Bienertia sinuspersici]